MLKRAYGFRHVLVGLAALGLAACSAAPQAAAEKSSPTPVPSPSYATENQVASVIAEYDADWRDVIDEAGSCRFLWTIGGSTVAEEIQGDTCYISEKTLEITAQIVTRDLSELDIPPSMDEIVNDTTTVLAGIIDNDMASVCGEDTRPIESTECNQALGSNNFYFSLLESELDKWKPYL